MKLAIITAYPPSKVTLNEYAYHLVAQFRQHPQITELILLTDFTDTPKILDFNNVGCKITVKPCWRFNSYSTLISVNKALNATKPDAVLFNLQFMKFGDKKIPAALGLLLPLLCKIKGIPNIALLHNILEEVDLGSAGFTANKFMQSLYGFIGTTLTRFILQADRVAVTMHKYVSVLKHKYRKTNIIQIPHGTFEIAQTPNYLVPETPYQVMTFGKFGTYKKVETMIEAVEKVRMSTQLPIEIVIAGTDNPNVLGYLKTVKNTYNHIKNIRFTGYVEETDVPKLFMESAVVVFPYTSTTGSSGVLHQAGSYGKAVVMPNLGDLAALVKDEGYDAAFFEPDNVDSMAKAIEKIIVDKSYRLALSKTNYKAATAFPMSKIADLYVQEFKAIQLKKNN